MQALEKQKIDDISKLKYKKKLRTAEKRKAWVSRILLWVMMAVVLFPVLAIISASMAKGNAFTQSTILPTSWTLENYKKVITNTNFLIWVKNSLIVCFVTAIIQLAMTIPAAFAFSKLRFAGRRKGLMFLLLLQMFPATMALPAILGIAYSLNGMDKILTLVIIGCGGSAYNIWLLKGFLDGIPKELSEAAFVDGATTFQTFIKIILPLTKNMLVVIFLFSFIGSYGEYIFASALLKDPDSQTLMVGLRSFINGKFSANWPQYSAAAVMASAPIVVLFLMSQKFISKGLVAGAVKG
ncbi:MAG: sugar ABC transporter permease [Clostridium perfringens]|nr:sugar ABC transporter permease [Clostridium perfringens]